MRNILVICGPTATGKTSLALRIAGLLPRVNILSADSRQIYQGLDIVTGKDLPKSLSKNIKFFGLDLASPNQIFNVSDFAKYSQQVIEDSIAQKIPLIIVGGTGLYLQAITSNLLNVHVPPNAELRARLEKLDVESQRNMLFRISPQKVRSMNHSDIHNPRRLIRAIEIASSLRAGRGPLIPDGVNPGLAIPAPFFHWIGLKQNTETQKINIRHRVIERLDTGALSEIENLLEKYPDHQNPLFSSLGVKQIIAYQNQKISLEELITLWTQAENDYARRQMVWFRKQPGIIWYDRGKINQPLVKKLAKIITTNA